MHHRVSASLSGRSAYPHLPGVLASAGNTAGLASPVYQAATETGAAGAGAGEDSPQSTITPFVRHQALPTVKRQLCRYKGPSCLGSTEVSDQVGVGLLVRARQTGSRPTGSPSTTSSCSPGMDGVEQQQPVGSPHDTLDERGLDDDAGVLPYEGRGWLSGAAGRLAADRRKVGAVLLVANVISHTRFLRVQELTYEVLGRFGLPTRASIGEPPFLAGRTAAGGTKRRRARGCSGAGCA